MRTGGSERLRASLWKGDWSPLLGAAFESGLLPPQSILGMATVPALPGP